jgi:hypothetical protein
MRFGFVKKQVHHHPYTVISTHHNRHRIRMSFFRQPTASVIWPFVVRLLALPPNHSGYHLGWIAMAVSRLVLPLWRFVWIAQHTTPHFTHGSRAITAITHRSIRLTTPHSVAHSIIHGGSTTSDAVRAISRLLLPLWPSVMQHTKLS